MHLGNPSWWLNTGLAEALSASGHPRVPTTAMLAKRPLNLDYVIELLIGNVLTCLARLRMPVF